MHNCWTRLYGAVFRFGLEMPRALPKINWLRSLKIIKQKCHSILVCPQEQVTEKVAFDSFSAVEDFCRDVYRRAVLKQATKRTPGK